MKKFLDKGFYALFLSFLFTFIMIVVFAVIDVNLETKLEAAKTPVEAVEMEQIRVSEDISTLSQAIMGQFQGKPVRYLLDRGPETLSFVVFDTEKSDFEHLIWWFEDEFEVLESVNGVYYMGVSEKKGLLCSVFFSGKGDDMAQLTYVKVANSRRISTELWPEIVVN